MSRRLPILALALVLVVGLGFLWKSISPPSSGPDEAALSAPGTESPALQPEAVAELPSAPDIAARPEVSEREVAIPTPAAVQPEEVLTIPDDSLWFEGRLIFPDKLPLDESFKIVASGRRFGDDRKAPRKHRVDTDPAGRFRIAYAKKTSSGSLRLEARYMYLPSSIRIKPKSHEGEIVLNPLLGGVLRGVVAPPPGHEAIAETFDGVQVNVREWRGSQPFNRSTPLSADGGYELTALPPSSDYNLTLVSSKFAGSDQDDVSIRPGDVTEIDLSLTLGVLLAGRVIAADGTAVKGATVNLLVTREANGGTHSNSERDITDEAGEFSFDGAMPGAMKLSIRAEGAPEIEDDLGSLEDGIRRTDLLYTTGSGGSVTGIVRWEDGTPAVGVKVGGRPVEASGGLDWNAREYNVKTDESGAFELTGLDQRDLVVDASGRRILADSESRSKLRRKKRGPTLSARQDGVRPGTRGIQLVLSVGEVLRGSVLYVGGGSVGTFVVNARPDWQEETTLDWNDSVTRKFDSEDGEYELTGLKPGAWRVTVSGKDFAETDATAVQIPHEGRLDFTVAKAAGLKGRVVSPGGDPIAAAEITMVRVTGNSRSWSGDGELTDSKGEFAIKSLEPGDYEVRATAEGWAPGENAALTLAPGEEREDLILIVQSAARLTGQILPGSGELASRRVQAWGGDNHAFESTESDSEGHFEFDNLGPGTYEVQLMAESGGEEDWQMDRANAPKASVELVSGSTVHIELGGGAQQPRRVHGRVTAGGTGVADCMLHFNDNTRDVNAAVRTDASGAYSVVVDGAGGYSVTARAAGTEFGVSYNVFSIEVGEGSEQREDFVLPTARLELTLIKPDGSPGSGVLVGLEALDVPGLEGNVSRDQQADDEGQFVFQYLQPGTYQLRAGGDATWGEDGGAYARQVSELRIEVGANLKRRLRLEDGARVSGLATYSDGALATNLPVRAYNSAGQEVTLLWRTTDEQGRFNVGGLPGGAIKVQVGPEGSGYGESNVHLPRGGQGQVNVSVPR